jgi:hypothetical protein
MTDTTLGLYLFDEQGGALVRNHTATGPDLSIPVSYQAMQKLFLEPPWSEFRMSRNYWVAVLKNIGVLIPLGFCVFLRPSRHSSARQGDRVAPRDAGFARDLDDRDSSGLSSYPRFVYQHGSNCCPLPQAVAQFSRIPYKSDTRRSLVQRRGGRPL